MERPAVFIPVAGAVLIMASALFITEIRSQFLSAVGLDALAFEGGHLWSAGSVGLLFVIAIINRSRYKK